MTVTDANHAPPSSERDRAFARLRDSLSDARRAVEDPAMRAHLSAASLGTLAALEFIAESDSHTAYRSPG